MTQSALILDLFARNGGRLTTNDFCSTPPLAAEYRARISELRRKGYVIECTGSKPNFTYQLLTHN